jgi:hypothetical protein
MSAWWDRMRWSGVAVILGIIGVRMVTEHARIPWWDVDPLVSPIPETRITPALSMVLDAVVMVAAALVVWAESVRGRRVGAVVWVGVLIGCAGVLAHGYVLTPFGGSTQLRGDTRALTIGATWASAVAGACALWMAFRDARVRGLVAGVLIGAAAPVVAVGAVQVFVEHAATVRMFDADPVGSLASAGIAPGSPGAASFERRLRQPEATGAFGLANVFGTVVAASAAFWVVMGFGAWRARWGRGMAIGAVGVGASVVGLWLSGSKGAAVAGVFGVGLVGAIAMLARVRGSRAWMGRVLGVMAILVPLGAVVARGAVGERIGELSLLFRWHYLQASARIIGEYPWFGVGPGNFKGAYLVAKNPLNPEQVESPHSVALDWVSTVGVFGWAWVLVLVCAAGAIGVGLWKRFTAEHAEIAEQEREGSRDRGIKGSREGGREGSREEGSGARLLPVVVPVLAVSVSMWIGREAMGPERALAMAVGVAVWVMVALWVARASARMGKWVAVAGACAGLVALAHGQIEVTPVMAGSAGWWAAVVGMGVGARSPDDGRKNRGGFWIGFALLLLGMGVVTASELSRWERELHRAWVRVGAGDIDEAKRRLGAAFRLQPEFLSVVSELVRLDGMGATPGRTGHQIGASLVEMYPGRVEVWTIAARGRLGHQPPMVEGGIVALSRAIALDPWSVVLAVRLAELSAETNDRTESARWARKALENDEWLRLDPVVRMDGATRGRMEALATGGGGPERGGEEGARSPVP